MKLPVYQVGLLALVSLVASLEMYYEFVGSQPDGIPRGPKPQPRDTVMSNLKKELGTQHRFPLLTKHLTKGLNGGRLNTSGLVLHGRLGDKEAKALQLTESEAHEINQILPEADFNHQYSSCAVVGNSASLMQYQYGNEIDGHDVVLRFNDAPTRTFEEHTGRRCTFRAISHEHTRQLIGLSKVPERGDAHKGKGAVKPGARTVLVMPDTPLRYYADLRHKFPENVIMYMKPEMAAAANKLYQQVVDRLARLGEREAMHADDHPTGLVAVLFLMQVCRKVSLYGFQPTAPPRGSSMPSAMYYDKVLTDSDITASPVNFLFWRVLNTENLLDAANHREQAAASRAALTPPAGGRGRAVAWVAGTAMEASAARTRRPAELPVGEDGAAHPGCGSAGRRMGGEGRPSRRAGRAPARPSPALARRQARRGGRDGAAIGWLGLAALFAVASALFLTDPGARLAAWRLGKPYSEVRQVNRKPLPSLEEDPEVVGIFSDLLSAESDFASMVKKFEGGVEEFDEFSAKLEAEAERRRQEEDILDERYKELMYDQEMAQERMAEEETAVEGLFLAKGDSRGEVLISQHEVGEDGDGGPAGYDVHQILQAAAAPLEAHFFVEENGTVHTPPTAAVSFSTAPSRPPGGRKHRCKCW
eukprot:jgi/Tetstr1/463548/TSEL_008427.t1